MHKHGVFVFVVLVVLLLTLSQLFWDQDQELEQTTLGRWQTIELLHFTDKKLVRNGDEILNSTWVSELQHMLRVPGVGKQVSVIFGDSIYLDGVLNWLIAAKVRLQPPLKNVIVCCLDRKVFSILDQRKIPSIHIDPNSVFNNHTKLKFQDVWIIRLIVYRLINHFGHDVVSYDSDAIVLRNPQKLFEEHHYSDIVSSAGIRPRTLSSVWGFTACMGVILFRSTPQTGITTLFVL